MATYASKVPRSAPGFSHIRRVSASHQRETMLPAPLESSSRKHHYGECVNRVSKKQYEALDEGDLNQNISQADGDEIKQAHRTELLTSSAHHQRHNLQARPDPCAGSLQQGMDWKVQSGVPVLGWCHLVLPVLGFLVVPLVMGARSQQLRPVRLLYFIAVGLGYILVEIAFIQRFVLFLGHPVYALTVVVFLLLLSSGAGSMVSRWWLAETRRIWLTLVLTRHLAGVRRHPARPG